MAVLFSHRRFLWRLRKSELGVATFRTTKPCISQQLQMRFCGFVVRILKYYCINQEKCVIEFMFIWIERYLQITALVLIFQKEKVGSNSISMHPVVNTCIAPTYYQNFPNMNMCINFINFSFIPPSVSLVTNSQCRLLRLYHRFTSSSITC